MIWLKENNNFVGYVPVLKKEYSEQEIREMSKFNCYEGWSRLSSLVMRIQGIGFAYNGGFSHHYRVGKAQKLVDIRFDFDFECFLLPTNPRMEKYISQIFEVFENLTLYKVEEHSEEEIKETIAKTKHTLEHLVSSKTLSYIDNDISSYILGAESSFTNLSKLQKMFEDRGTPLTHDDIFANIDEAPSKEIYTEREIQTILKMSCY